MKVLIALLLVISFQAKAVIVTDCGEYQLRGKIVVDESQQYKLKFVVFPGTKSALDFGFASKEDFFKISSFLNQEIELKGKILSKMEGTKGNLVDITGIKIVQINPLTQEGSLKQIESLKCR